MSVSFDPGLGRVRYWHALRSHGPLIVTVTVVALIAALLVVVTATKRYDATSKLQIQPRGAFSQTDPLQGSPVFFQPADGSSAAVAAASVFSGSIGDFHRTLGSVGRGASISVTPLSQAAFVAIQASAPTGKQARDVANRFASFIIRQRRAVFQTWLSQKMSDIRGAMQGLPEQSAQFADLSATLATLKSYLGRGGDPTVIQLPGTEASIPGGPSWPRPKTTLAVALLVGLLLGLAAAVALEVVNPRVSREDDLRQAHRLPVLARIPRLPSRVIQSYFLGSAPLPHEAWKAYRTLRAALSNAGDTSDRFPSTILVTSAGPGDGKTLTAVNLAIALSSAGLSVTLVDADLPRPMVGTIFNIIGHRDGLVHLLNNPNAPRTGVVEAPLHARLKLLLASAEQMHELHLFEATRIRAAFDRLAKESDVVIIDSPPLPEVAEAVALADASEAVVLCVRIGHTRRDKLAELRDLLGRRGVVPLGLFVTTRERPRRGGDRAYPGYPGELPVIPGDYLLSPSPSERLPSAESS